MEENEQEQPQGFALPLAVSGYTKIFQFIFNFKFLSIFTIVILCGVIYFQSSRIEKAELERDKQVLLTQNAEKDALYCNANFDSLEKTISDAAKASKELNEGFFDLTTEVEKFNKINKNNSKDIETLRKTAVASSCNDAIKELVESLENGER